MIRFKILNKYLNINIDTDNKSTLNTNTKPVSLVVFNIERKRQEEIFERLCNQTASQDDYLYADNVTRARYACFMWPKFTDLAKCHFMFHTKKEFNGFSDGTKMPDCPLCTGKILRSDDMYKICIIKV